MTVQSVERYRERVQDTTTAAQGQVTFTTGSRLIGSTSTKTGRGVANARNAVTNTQTTVASNGSITFGGAIAGGFSFLLFGVPETDER